MPTCVMLDAMLARIPSRNLPGLTWSPIAQKAWKLPLTPAAIAEFMAVAFMRFLPVAFRNASLKIVDWSFLMMEPFTISFKTV